MDTVTRDQIKGELSGLVNHTATLRTPHTQLRGIIQQVKDNHLWVSKPESAVAGKPLRQMSTDPNYRNAWHLPEKAEMRRTDTALIFTYQPKDRGGKQPPKTYTLTVTLG